MSKEIWRETKWPGYFVSTHGRVKSPRKLLKPCITPKGYLTVCLTSNRKPVTRRIHRLVAEAFLGDSGGLQVNHKDFNKKNNRVDNLEYVTPLQNIIHWCTTRKTRGVSFCKQTKKWNVELVINRKRLRLGRYAKIEDAIAVRRKAEKEHWR